VSNRSSRVGAVANKQQRKLNKQHEKPTNEQHEIAQAKKCAKTKGFNLGPSLVGL